jgi:hypothetical protein
MFRKSLMSLALIGAGALGLSAIPASAVALPAVHQNVSDNGSVQLVAKRDRVVRDLGDRNVRRYDRRYDGPRCLRRYGNCTHYYRGYYYSSPWWTLPLIGGTLFLGSRYYDGGYYSGGGYGSRHVRWCYNHYRSYNARTNTWISYSGNVRQCRSPYWP